MASKINLESMENPLCHEGFSTAADFMKLDKSAQYSRRPSIRELLSRSDSSEAFESLSRGEYVGNLLSIVLSRTTGLSSPSASTCAGDTKCEVKFQSKSRYGRENRRSFLRSLSSMRDEDEDSDHLSSTPIISGSDDSDENLDTPVLPRVRRKSFIFNDYALSKEGLLERGLGSYQTCCISYDWSDYRKLTCSSFPTFSHSSATTLSVKFTQRTSRRAFCVK
jgi:hypothetical protein